MILVYIARNRIFLVWYIYVYGVNMKFLFDAKIYSSVISDIRKQNQITHKEGKIMLSSVFWEKPRMDGFMFLYTYLRIYFVHFHVL